MTNSPYTVPMNIISAYFHKIVAINVDAEVTVSGSGVGASFSISPKLHFNKIINNVEYKHSM